jgi:hypothetical protein
MLHVFPLYISPIVRYKTRAKDAKHRVSTTPALNIMHMHETQSIVSLRIGINKKIPPAMPTGSLISECLKLKLFKACSSFS